MPFVDFSTMHLHLISSICQNEDVNSSHTHQSCFMNAKDNHGQVYLLVYLLYIMFVLYFLNVTRLNTILLLVHSATIAAKMYIISNSIKILLNMKKMICVENQLDHNLDDSCMIHELRTCFMLTDLPFESNYGRF